MLTGRHRPLGGPSPLLSSCSPACCTPNTHTRVTSFCNNGGSYLLPIKRPSPHRDVVQSFGVAPRPTRNRRVDASSQRARVARCPLRPARSHQNAVFGFPPRCVGRVAETLPTITLALRASGPCGARSSCWQPSSSQPQWTRSPPSQLPLDHAHAGRRLEPCCRSSLALCTGTLSAWRRRLQPTGRTCKAARSP